MPVITDHLPLETVAIVEATAPDVHASRAAIVFRTWHYLDSEEARRLLFEEFVLDGRVLGLVEAIAATVHRGSWAGATPRSLIQALAQERTSFQAKVEHALILALNEVLGSLATTLVLNAWRQAYRFFMRQLALHAA